VKAVQMSQVLGSLVGSRVTGVGRTAHLMEIGFDQDGTRYSLTAYCPLRVVREDRILLGAADMNHPEDREMDVEEAYEAGATMYDRNARRLTDIFTRSVVVVSSAEVDAAGAVGIEATGSFRIELMPTSARARLETWRLHSLPDS
jgi:hypothetical protein